MGRRKIEIKAIKDDRNRSVTFLKRKGGLFKKAHELSVLCSVDVAVIIFGHNKKLYEFSSGDINETIGRYQYVCQTYGGPHEHKGPQDFMGKKDGDDDDDDDEAGDDRPESHSPPTHAMMPHHLQNQPAFQHMGTPSASPPMPNGTFHHRGPSPQPQHLSRPGSRAHMRQGSAHLLPPQHPHLQVSQPPQPQQPSYAYMPNPPIYNPQTAAGMQIRPQQGQPQPPQFQFTQHPPQHPPPPPPHQPPPPQHAQMQQVYQQEQRRQSLPPNMPTPEQRPPQPAAQPSPQPPQQQFHQSPPMPQPKPLPSAAKTHSIFTPIDDSRSLLAQHWGSTTQAEQPKLELTVKNESGLRSQSIDVAVMGRSQVNGVNGHLPHQAHSVQASNAMSQPQRTASTPVLASEPIQPPSRTNSLQANRPRLKVQIPTEASDDEKQTAESSPHATATANAATPIRTGAVLPPPSPSAASALLSAGATGPPNPFARPAPPVTNGAFGSRSEIETPKSALPSRFMSEQLLGSPSGFEYWGFGKDNTLPSPLAAINFGQTPIVPNGPSFRDDDPDRKRKVSDGVDENTAKRIKA